MRKYETVFIFRPDLSEDQINATLDKVKSRVDSAGGKSVSISEWGIRKLAYTIKYRGERFKRGFYLVFTFLGNGKLVDELDRMTSLMDEVVRTQTIKLEEDVDPATITELIVTKEEMPEPEPVRVEEEEETLISSPDTEEGEPEKALEEDPEVKVKEENEEEQTGETPEYKEEDEENEE